MSDIKIENIDDNNLDNKDLRKVAKSICSGMPSSITDNYNMTKGLFADGGVLYLNTTEELMMKHFIKPGSKVATVLAGGDFLIDSIFHGANDILTFDINKFQYYPSSLKIKFLQNMSYEEFCSFFSDEYVNSLLSKDVYEKKVKGIGIDDDISSFMNVIIDRYIDAKRYVRKNIKKDPLYLVLNDLIGEDYDDIEIERIISKMSNNFDNMTDLDFNKLFCKLGIFYKQPELFRVLHGLNVVRYSGSYLENEDNYNNTKDLISNCVISFINTDVNNLKYKLKRLGYLDSDFKGFDSIYLSNIPEYMNGSFLVHTIENDLIDLLADDGVIVYSCLGVSNDRLTNSSCGDFDVSCDNPLVLIRLINDINGYNLLKDKYNVSTIESNYKSLNNGYEDKDTFVFVKRK